MVAEQKPQQDQSQALDFLRIITEGWEDLPEPAALELRCLFPGRSPSVSRYSPDEEGFSLAIDHATAMNQSGLNVYPVINPVRASAPLRRDGKLSGALDDDIIGSFFFWADADDEAATYAIKNFAGPKFTMSVTTGRVPFVRPHVYWRIEDGLIQNLELWSDIQRGIAAQLSTDKSVINPARIMRLPGMINWPTEDKAKNKGRVPEMATLRTDFPEDRDPVPFERMRRIFEEAGKASRTKSGGSDTGGNFSFDTGGDQRSIADYADILRRARTDGEKHTGVRDLSASLAGAGVPIALACAIVKEVCPVWDEGVEKLIKTAYAKFYPVAKTDQFINLSDDGDENDWLAQLIVNSRGRAVFNTANAMLVLENHPDLKGCFAYDEFRQAKLVTKPLPGSSAPKASFQGRDYRDSDTIQVVSHFNRNGFPDATKTTIADAIDAVAEQSTFHPVRNYLNDLPAWDGVQRIDGWLQDYCNVEPQTAAETAYTREVASKWLISAVARVMVPGCKADGVLILEGSQGARKSTTLRFLAGEDWFGDSLPPMSSKDASDYLRGKWIIEMAELSNINKAEVEVVKAFISRENERFRPAYARTEITYPRQCVFAGSTNKSDYLRDETGNRRFWPVKVNGFCDTHGIREDRDQIWAEALARYKAGETWWLSAESEETAKTQQEQRVSQDAWEGDIANFCVGRSEVSPAEVGTKALGIDLGRLDRAATNRITAVLAALGYVRRGQFTSGDNKGRARYVQEGQQ